MLMLAKYAESWLITVLLQRQNNVFISDDTIKTNCTVLFYHLQTKGISPLYLESNLDYHVAEHTTLSGQAVKVLAQQLS